LGVHVPILGSCQAQIGIKPPIGLIVDKSG
jgi:hypothetical protein